MKWLYFTLLFDYCFNYIVRRIEIEFQDNKKIDFNKLKMGDTIPIVARTEQYTFDLKYCTVVDVWYEDDMYCLKLISTQYGVQIIVKNNVIVSIKRC